MLRSNSRLIATSVILKNYPDLPAARLEIAITNLVLQEAGVTRQGEPLFDCEEVNRWAAAGFPCDDLDDVC
jgi:hypothetical protein